MAVASPHKHGGTGMAARGKSEIGAHEQELAVHAGCCRDRIDRSEPEPRPAGSYPLQLHAWRRAGSARIRPL